MEAVNSGSIRVSKAATTGANEITYLKLGAYVYPRMVAGTEQIVVHLSEKHTFCHHLLSRKKKPLNHVVRGRI
jgi:hypothetical protein